MFVKKTRTGSIALAGGTDRAEEAYYVKREASLEDHLERHARFGYDPLDRALREEGLSFERELSTPSPKKPPVEGSFPPNAAIGRHRTRVRRLIRAHLDYFQRLGLTYTHTFEGESLGLTIVIGRYGDHGRNFVMIDSMMKPGTPAWGVVKPTDELLMINGLLVIEPDEESFETLQESIRTLQRPLQITFVMGEDREQAFEKERRMSLSGDELARVAAEAYEALKLRVEAESVPGSTFEVTITGPRLGMTLSRTSKGAVVASKVDATLAEEAPRLQRYSQLVLVGSERLKKPVTHDDFRFLCRKLKLHPRPLVLTFADAGKLTPTGVLYALSEEQEEVLEDEEEHQRNNNNTQSTALATNLEADFDDEGDSDTDDDFFGAAVARRSSARAPVDDDYAAFAAKKESDSLALVDDDEEASQEEEESDEESPASRRRRVLERSRTTLGVNSHMVVLAASPDEEEEPCSPSAASACSPSAESEACSPSSAGSFFVNAEDCDSEEDFDTSLPMGTTLVVKDRGKDDEEEEEEEEYEDADDCDSDYSDDAEGSSMPMATTVVVKSRGKDEEEEEKLEEEQEEEWPATSMGRDFFGSNLEGTPVSSPVKTAVKKTASSTSVALPSPPPPAAPEEEIPPVKSQTRIKKKKRRLRPSKLLRNWMRAVALACTPPPAAPAEEKKPPTDDGASFVGEEKTTEDTEEDLHVDMLINDHEDEAEEEEEEEEEEEHIEPIFVPFPYRPTPSHSLKNIMIRSASTMTDSTTTSPTHAARMKDPMESESPERAPPPISISTSVSEHQFEELFSPLASPRFVDVDSQANTPRSEVGTQVNEEDYIGDGQQQQQRRMKKRAAASSPNIQEPPPRDFKNARQDPTTVTAAAVASSLAAWLQQSTEEKKQQERRRALREEEEEEAEFLKNEEEERRKPAESEEQEEKAAASVKAAEEILRKAAEEKAAAAAPSVKAEEIIAEGAAAAEKEKAAADVKAAEEITAVAERAAAAADAAAVKAEGEIIAAAERKAAEEKAAEIIAVAAERAAAAESSIRDSVATRPFSSFSASSVDEEERRAGDPRKTTARILTPKEDRGEMAWSSDEDEDEGDPEDDDGKPGVFSCSIDGDMLNGGKKQEERLTSDLGRSPSPRKHVQEGDL